MRQNGVLYYLLTDHLGSTSAVIDQNGAVVARQLYTPYGEARGASGTLPTDYKFTGQRAETGLGSLYDYNARHYSPALGRFLSPDTIVPSPGNPQSLNRYAYTLNNPLKYNDPSGHIANWVVGGIVGGLVGGGLYLANELRQGDLNLNVSVSFVGGFKVDVGDWGDLTAATGMGAAAGTLIATPGMQGIGIGMAANLLSDHTVNLFGDQDFYAGGHAITGAMGGLEVASGVAVAQAASKVRKVAQVAVGFGTFANSAAWGGIEGGLTAKVENSHVGSGAVAGVLANTGSQFLGSGIVKVAAEEAFARTGRAAIRLGDELYANTLSTIANDVMFWAGRKAWLNEQQPR